MTRLTAPMPAATGRAAPLAARLLSGLRADPGRRARADLTPSRDAADALMRRTIGYR